MLRLRGGNSSTCPRLRLTGKGSFDCGVGRFADDTFAQDDSFFQSQPFP
jgi:hypothetical protein